MNLSDARKAKIPRKKKFPAGHGHSSGLGKYCGRGNKGQGSRQGESNRFRTAFEGGQMSIIRRLPKFGFNNAEFRRAYEEINVGTIDKHFDDGATVDEAALREKGLIRRHLPIKVLGDGPMARKLTVKAHKFSKSAAEKIQKAGGTIVPLEAPKEEPKRDPVKAAAAAAKAGADKPAKAPAPKAEKKAPEAKGDDAPKK